jgi:hypothetical protein
MRVATLPGSCPLTPWELHLLEVAPRRWPLARRGPTRSSWPCAMWSLTLPAAPSITAIVGESGSGKTTRHASCWACMRLRRAPCSYDGKDLQQLDRAACTLPPRSTGGVPGPLQRLQPLPSGPHRCCRCSALGRPAPEAAYNASDSVWKRWVCGPTTRSDVTRTNSAVASGSAS